MARVSILKEAGYRLGISGNFIAIPDVFSVEWTPRRGFVYAPGIPTVPDYIALTGKILTFDPDIAFTLIDLTPAALHDYSDPATLCELQVKYNLAGTPTVTKTRTFKRVAFGNGGAAMETLEDKVDRGGHPLFSIPFLISADVYDSFANLVTTV